MPTKLAMVVYACNSELEGWSGPKPWLDILGYSAMSLKNKSQWKQKQNPVKRCKIMKWNSTDHTGSQRQKGTLTTRCKGCSLKSYLQTTPWLICNVIPYLEKLGQGNWWKLRTSLGYWVRPSGWGDTIQLVRVFAAESVSLCVCLFVSIPRTNTV